MARRLYYCHNGWLLLLEFLRPFSKLRWKKMENVITCPLFEKQPRIPFRPFLSKTWSSLSLMQYCSRMSSRLYKGVPFLLTLRSPARRLRPIASSDLLPPTSPPSSRPVSSDSESLRSTWNKSPWTADLWLTSR